MSIADRLAELQNEPSLDRARMLVGHEAAAARDLVSRLADATDAEGADALLGHFDTLRDMLLELRGRL